MALGPTPQPDLRSYYAQQISWENCAEEMAQELVRERANPSVPSYVARFECGTVKVPRDYANPRGKAGTAKISMVRLGATDPEQRIGSLVLNFGGPGISGRMGLNNLADKFSRLNARYDLVAHDPRGVHDSDPVLCAPPVPDGTDGTDGVDQTPDTMAEAARIAEAQRRSNARCKEALPVLPWVGTVNSARDLDVMRAALGEEKLTYLGFSYGTKLGAVYLHQFPDKAGHFVLDGVDDPTLDTRGAALANTKAFQKALDSFLADCVGHGAQQCPLGATTDAAKQKVDGLFNALDQNPLKTDAGTLDQGTFTRGVENALYSKADGWPNLRTALTDLARKNDGTLLAGLAGNPLGSGTGAAPTDIDPSQQEDALRAITCRDTSDRPTPQDFEDAVAEFTKASPIFGRYTAASMLECTGWPVAGDDTSRQVTAKDAPPALLVATRGDPATPYENTAHMAKALGNDSSILTYEGEGHGAYLTKSTCVHQHVERFLTEGKLPAGDTTCNK